MAAIATISTIDTKDQAIRALIRAAKPLDRLRKGLHESVKSLDRGEAVVCFLADDCDQPKLKQIVQALCKQNSIALVAIPTRQDLGRHVGLIKYKADGTLNKIVKTSVAVVTKWPPASEQYRHLVLGQ